MNWRCEDREGVDIYAIGCDVGSQSLKGVLIDPGGRLAATASAAYRVSYPHPGWAEQDPALWERALADVIAALRAEARIPAHDIGAIALGSQVDGIVAVDTNLQPLRPALIWMDRRATAQADDLRARIDPDELRAITGSNLDAYHGGPKIAWIRDTEPELAKRAVAYLLPGSYLVARLCGERVADHANASTTLLYDVRARDWSARLLELADLAPEQLGRVEPATSVAGTVTPGAAEQFGLEQACRVLVGTGDEHAAALAAGAVREGIVCDITGTAEPVGVGATSPIVDETGLVETHGHADPRAWFVENPGFVSGGSVRWFLDVFGGDEARMNAEAAEALPGSNGVAFLPALSGSTTPRWDEHARGAFVGMSLAHGRGDLARALLEGCSFALRDLVDRLAELGLDSTEIRVVGGGARSELWLQMKADITGRTVRVLDVDEATALGAGFLAAVGTGTFDGLDDAIDGLTHLSPATHEPQADLRAPYEDAYARYRAAFDALAPLELGRVRAAGDRAAAVPATATAR